MTAPEATNEWDIPYTYGFRDDELIAAIRSSSTCVFIRNRSDGHPVGAVVGFRVIGDEIYTITNVLRAGYRSVRRDPRVCVVFDNPGHGAITIIGRAEIVEDMEFIRNAYRQGAAEHYLVKQGRLTTEQYLEMALTQNRRLLHIVQEKVFSLDLSKLPMVSDIE